MKKQKLITIKEAVSGLIKDGDTVVIGNFLHGTPYAIIHEIIRQKKKKLTIISSSSIEEIDLLIGGGCISKVITSYYHRAGGKLYQRCLDRTLKDKSIEFEDYSNFTVISMLMAGALGYSFMPVLNSIKESDVFRIRTFMGEDKFKVIKCPFTSKETVVVPALNPDVAIVHVQRADMHGNAQFYGSLGTLKWSALAAKKVIVSCEELVDHEKIKRTPFLTIIPGFRVNAVCEEPLGAHPSPLAGYYNTDINFRSLYYGYAGNQIAFDNFIKEWIYDRKDRKDFFDHYVKRFGREPLELLKVNDYMSEQINLGFKMPYWQKDFCTKIALTKEQYYKKVEDMGELDL